MLCWIALLLASTLNAQVAPAPKYRVVKPDNPEKTLAAVNALADQGYRVLVTGKMFILRQEAKPPDTYRYVATDAKGGPVEFLNWLNEQGAHGYRLAPWAGMLEKEPHPRNYEYAAPSRAYHRGKEKWAEISSLVNQGYQPVGIAWFSLYIGAPWQEMFFERELSAVPRARRIGEGREIEVADGMRAGTVMKKVDELAKKNYRYLFPYPSERGGGIALMLQKCDRDCGGPFEYRYFDVHDMNQLVEELDKQGKEGFRVVPQALPLRPHVLERAGTTETYAYHVVKVKEAAELEQVLNGTDQEGFVPIGYVWRVGWTAEAFLLLEEEVTYTR
jgi:hypothetical protein